VIFVNHSAEEAIYLADRITVITPRPATIAKDIAVKLPRLRDAASVEFNPFKKYLF
jgi:ABC-type nitrate/sulfonate/bicarbonate transport system ATPase subunit